MRSDSACCSVRFMGLISVLNPYPINMFSLSWKCCLLVITYVIPVCDTVNLRFVASSSVIVKLPSIKGWQKWELLNMFASRLHHLVLEPLLFFCQKGNKIRFLMCFWQLLYQKIVFYSLVIIIQFCHRWIIRDDKTVICYFMPRHETSKFLHNFKANRYM